MPNTSSYTMERPNEGAVMEIKIVGDLWADNGHGSAAGRVYDIGGVSPCIGASHFNSIVNILVCT